LWKGGKALLCPAKEKKLFRRGGEVTNLRIPKNGGDTKKEKLATERGGEKPTDHYHGLRRHGFLRGDNTPGRRILGRKTPRTCPPTGRARQRKEERGRLARIPAPRKKKKPRKNKNERSISSFRKERKKNLPTLMTRSTKKEKGRVSSKEKKKGHCSYFDKGGNKKREGARAGNKSFGKKKADLKEKGKATTNKGGRKCRRPVFSKGKKHTRGKEKVD